MPDCYRCGSRVTADGVGLNRKLVNRGITEYLCMSCLAEHFHTTEPELQKMIEHFRAAGCQLFAPAEPEKQKRKR